MKNEDRNYLRHIQDFIARIANYTQGGKAEFFATPMIQDAVVRNVEVIGEAVKNLSPELKASRPEIPWRLIGRMRDKIIHHYFGLDLNLVWEVVEKDIPVLQAAISAMLSDAAPPPPATELPPPHRLKVLSSPACN